MSFFINFIEKGINLFNFDKKHQIFFAFECIVEMFRVIMASAFMIFTPQKCYINNNCVFDYTQPSHICSIQENLSCHNEYQNFVLYFNAFTIICFFVLYVVEIKRDDWLLMNFDYSKDSNETNLEKYRDDFPYLFTNLASYNKYYYFTYKILIIVYFLNLIFSAIILFGIKYNDINTVSIFLSSIFLCFNKITTGIYLSKLAVDSNLPISYYNRINLCFNEIDFEVKNNFYSKIDEYKMNFEKEYISKLNMKNIAEKNNLTKSRQNSLEKTNLTKNLQILGRSRQNSVEKSNIEIKIDNDNTSPKLTNHYLINQEINLRRNSMLRKSPNNSLISDLKNAEKDSIFFNDQLNKSSSSHDFKLDTVLVASDNNLNIKKNSSNSIEDLNIKTNSIEDLNIKTNSIEDNLNFFINTSDDVEKSIKISDLTQSSKSSSKNSPTKLVDSENIRGSNIFDKEEIKKIPGILIERIII
jgi:hypothetical protein